MAIHVGRTRADLGDATSEYIHVDWDAIGVQIPWSAQ